MPFLRDYLLMLLIRLLHAAVAKNLPKFLAMVETPQALVKQVRNVSKWIQGERHIRLIEAPTLLDRNLLSQNTGEIIIGFEVFPLAQLKKERG